MFGFGWTEIVLLALVGLFVFGPERLPTVVGDAARMLRQLRTMAQGMSADITAELGPELADLDLAALNPRTLLSRTLLGEDEPAPAPTPSYPEPLLTAAQRVLQPGEIPPYDAEAT